VTSVHRSGSLSTQEVRLCQGEPKSRPSAWQEGSFFTLTRATTKGGWHNGKLGGYHEKQHH
jgi:hypothetical protein